MTSQHWDETIDVLVVGSGGAGLISALASKKFGLNVMIVEKSPYYGGSTALSGGGVWIPNNYLMKQAGVEDSFEQAMIYLNAITEEKVSKERKKNFLINGPEMLNWLKNDTDVLFEYMNGYSDYYPEKPGGSAKGRGIEAKPFNGAKLGKDYRFLRPSLFKIPAGLAFTSMEYQKIGMITSTWDAKFTAFKIGLRTMFNLLFRRKYLTLGRALIARLRYSLKKQNVPFWLNSSLEDIMLENNQIVGVKIKKDNEDIFIAVSKGIILATGGFEHNLELRKTFQPSPISTEWTVGCDSNTGDALKIGMNLGAKVDLLDDAWWGPVSLPPDESPFFHVGERGYPGGIMVNKQGKRFTNESASYVDVVHAMYKLNKDTNPHIPAYFIFDNRYRKKYTFGTLFPRMKIPKTYLETGYIIKADTIEELAKSIDIPEKNLIETISKFNSYAIVGIDEDFQRGKSKYDNYYGDPKVKPNPNLAPLKNPPFYAVKFWPGDLGTKGGLLTNEYGQVIDEKEKVIPKLYAIGNVSSSIMANSYAGPGATIGPAMVFGYIAAKKIADQE